MPAVKRGRAVAGQRNAERVAAGTLGHRLQIARQLAGLTQRQLAGKLGITGAAVAQWETGWSVPASARLSAVARLLNVSPGWLLDGTDLPEPAAPEPEIAKGDRALLREARQLGVDLSEVVAEARRKRWLEENREALADANAFLARYGLWSDGRRQF